DRLYRHRALWSTSHPEFTVFERDIFDIGFQLVGSNRPRLLDHLSGAPRDCPATDRGASASVRPPTFGDLIRISLDDLNVVVGDAKFGRRDLGVRRPMALSLVRRPAEHRCRPSGVDANEAALPETGL